MAPEAESLRSILGATLGEITAIVPIESGTTGSSYRIDTVATRFVAKLFSSDSDALLGPRAQFELLTRLAATGIAPRPAACDESAGLLVTEYIGDAAAVNSDEIHRAEWIQKIGVLLGRLHRSGVEAPKFEPATYAMRYLSRLGGLERLSQPNRERGAELLELATNLDFDAACLCHNDLTADNILFGPSPKLIDFDYAALAPPLLDLASASFMNSFTPAEEQQLFDAYGADTEAPNFAVEFARVKRLIRLLSHFWSLASSDTEAAIVSQYRIDDV